MNIYINREIVTNINQKHYHISEEGLFGVAVWIDVALWIDVDEVREHHWASRWHIVLED